MNSESFVFRVLFARIKFAQKFNRINNNQFTKRKSIKIFEKQLGDAK